MMEAMEETLYQHGVDVVFAGHVHAYESSYPVFRWGSQSIDIMAASNLQLLSMLFFCRASIGCIQVHDPAPKLSSTQAQVSSGESSLLLVKNWKAAALLHHFHK